MAAEIKIFKVAGKFVKSHQHFAFTKYIRALSEDQAKEKALTLVTSEKIFRRKIHFTEISTVKPEDCPDAYVKALGEMK